MAGERRDSWRANDYDGVILDKTLEFNKLMIHLI